MSDQHALLRQLDSRYPTQCAPSRPDGWLCGHMASNPFQKGPKMTWRYTCKLLAQAARRNERKNLAMAERARLYPRTGYPRPGTGAPGPSVDYWLGAAHAMGAFARQLEYFADPSNKQYGSTLKRFKRWIEDNL